MRAYDECATPVHRITSCKSGFTTRGHLSHGQPAQFAALQELRLQRICQFCRAWGRGRCGADSNCHEAGFYNWSVLPAGHDVTTRNRCKSAGRCAAQCGLVDAIAVRSFDGDSPSCEFRGRQERRAVAPSTFEQCHTLERAGLSASGHECRAKKRGMQNVSRSNQRSEYTCFSPSAPGWVTAPLYVGPTNLANFQIAPDV